MIGDFCTLDRTSLLNSIELDGTQKGIVNISISVGVIKLKEIRSKWFGITQTKYIHLTAETLFYVISMKK